MVYTPIKAPNQGRQAQTSLMAEKGENFRVLSEVMTSKVVQVATRGVVLELDSVLEIAVNYTSELGLFTTSTIALPTVVVVTIHVGTCTALSVFIVTCTCATSTDDAWLAYRGVDNHCRDESY